MSFTFRISLSDNTFLARNNQFPSCLLPQFQNQSTCKTIEMKMGLICMKIDVQVKYIFICVVSHEDKK